MVSSINMPSLPVSASTSSATGTLPAGTGKYIRVVNGSASSAVHVKAGSGAQTATSSNMTIPALGERVFERNPNTDTDVGCILESGTGIVSFNVQGEPD